MTETDATPDVAALTVQLLSAYLSNNTVASDDLAELIRTTRAALTEDAAEPAPPEAETFQPAVSVRKSLAASSHIISLIDGKPYKTLKRHLAANGLTPDTYRSRYNLPATYPMVAPDYAAHRRAVAQKIGLGSRKAPAEASDEQELDLDAPADEVTQEPETKAPSKRGGKSAAAKKDAAPVADAPSIDAEGSGDPAAQVDVAEAPSSPKRKPRVSKAKDETADQGAEASAEQSEDTPPKRGRRKGAANAANNGEPSAKSKKPQRMARQAKADTSSDD